MSIVKSLIKYHKMIAHPEGGHYVEIFKNKDVSHIYFLLEQHEHSHWHRITKNETLHFYSGSPLLILSFAVGSIEYSYLSPLPQSLQCIDNNL